jgi:hypothetical protein
MPKQAQGKPVPPAFSPWFVAGYDGECDECGSPIEANYDEIRRTDSGYQGRECCGREDDDAAQG